MKKLVLVLGLAVGLLAGCDANPANDTYCMTEAVRITTAANEIRRQIENGEGNLKVHQIRLDALIEDLVELQKECN